MTNLRVVCFVSAATAITLGALPVVHARDIVVDVEGCHDGVAAELRSAMALELAPRWRVVAREASLHVIVRMADCGAFRWVLRVTNRRGDVLLGPDDLSLEALEPTRRPRIAALWVAERLPQVPLSATSTKRALRAGSGSGSPSSDGASTALRILTLVA